MAQNLETGLIINKLTGDTVGLNVQNSDVLINSITVGAGNSSVSTNTAVGYNALSKNTVGYKNVALGYGTLSANTIGYSNVSVGVNSLKSNIDGTYNIAIGENALLASTGASTNIAIGWDSMATSNIDADNSHSIGIGIKSLYKNNGTNNIGVGYSTLVNNTSGLNNIAIGYTALENNVSGGGNIAIGHQAGVDTQFSALTNTVVIGIDAKVTQSNSIILGNANNTNIKVGIGISSPSEKLEVSGKTKTTTLQVTNNATTGYVLTATDNLGNTSWQVPTGSGTFTGGTVAGASNFTNGLTASSINTNSLIVNGITYTAITDTFTTGFTYNDANRLTISRNQGQPDLNVFINTMSGLTVNGGVTATTMVLAPSPNASLIVRGTATTRGILPETDNTYSLGSTSQRWASMYTKEVRLYESKSGSAADNDYISILAPNDLALTPNPAWSLVLPYSSGMTFSLLGVYDGNAASNTSNTSWFTLSAGTNISLNQLAFSGGSVITINSTASGGGTFTGGTVAGASNFTGGLTANSVNTNSFTLNGVNYTSIQEVVNQGTGLTIHFSGKTIFNLPTSPADGNILHNLTNAKLGMIQKIYHSGSTVPTVPTEWQLVGEGTYFTYDLNIIYAEYVTNNWIEYWIIQKQI